MASKNNRVNVDDVIGMIFAEDNRDLGEESAEEETDDSWSETDEPSFYDNSNESTGKADDACFRDSALCDDVDLQPASQVELSSVEEDDSDEEYIPPSIEVEHVESDSSTGEDEVTEHGEGILGSSVAGTGMERDHDRVESQQGLRDVHIAGRGRGQGGLRSGGRGRGRRGRGQGQRGRGQGQRGRGRGGHGRGRRKSNLPQRKWTTFQGIEHHPNQHIGFHEVCGPSRTIRHLQQPLEFFMLFMTREIVQMIVEQTNLYCRQSHGGNSPAGWTDVTYQEILAFFGVVIAMGLVKLPDINDYWATKGINHIPWFPSILSRKRFQQITRYFHCVDNNDTPARDHPNYKLFKVNWIIDKLNNTFREYYVPTQNLSVDEQMIGTKCRVSFLQYMPKKPKKFGIKLWALCEALSGYCLQYQIYTGKINNQVEVDLGYRVVFDLLRYYLNRGYRVFFDNYYTSVKLVADLAAQQTFSCGTVRINRKNLPADFTTLKLKKGEAKFWKSDVITAVLWQDKRTVTLLSSFISNDIIDIPLRRGEETAITKPKMICEYNKYMNGVDKCDQYLNYYTIGRKARKWWKKVFFRMMELSIINSMVLFLYGRPELAKKKQSHKLYRHALVHQLVQPLLDLRSNPGQLNIPGPGRKPLRNDQRLRGKHFPQHTQKRKRCVVCAYQKNENGKYKDTKTVNYCPKCDKHICIGCFETYHTRSNF